MDAHIQNNIIQLKNLALSYGINQILKDINLSITSGEIISIIGPSGEGKTTLLECISGTIYDKKATLRGSIYINELLCNDVEPQKRNIGMVFQDLALFNHLNVEDNLAFPLKIKHYPNHVIKEKVDFMLDLIKLSDKKKSSMKNLSGGEKQRVALARALIYEPPIILMDEPLKALDFNLKVSFIKDLMNIHDKLKFTLIFVTHDHNEAFLLSDRIAILHSGVIIQVDTPENIYKKPDNINSARLIGESNWIKLDIIELGQKWAFDQDKNILTMPNTETSIKFSHNDKAILWFRPESLSLNHNSIVEDKKSEMLHLKGTVIESVFMGNGYRIKTSIGNEAFLTFNSAFNGTPGENVSLSISIHDTKIFNIN